MMERKRQSEATKVLERGLMVLEHVAAKGICTARELSAETGLSRTAVYRILESLCRSGYLYRVAHSEAYRQTAKLLDLAARVPSRAIVADIARPIMAEASKRLGWPLLLAYIDGIDVVVLETTDHLVKRNVKRILSGQRIPQFLRAAGAACKSLLDPAEARQINKKTIAVHSDQLFSHSETYRTQLLNRVRQQGFVIFEPLRSKEGSIAVPIKLSDGSIYGLELRFISTLVRSDIVKTEYLSILRNAALLVTKEANASLSRRGSVRKI